MPPKITKNKTVVKKPTPVKRKIIANLPYTAKNKNLELFKTLLKYGKEFGYINSRNSKITNTVIKSQKGDEYTIEFTITALDGGQEFINKIKNKDIINEFNQMKRIGSIKNKYTPEIISKLKFIK